MDGVQPLNAAEIDQLLRRAVVVAAQRVADRQSSSHSPMKRNDEHALEAQHRFVQEVGLPDYGSLGATRIWNSNSTPEQSAIPTACASKCVTCLVLAKASVEEELNQQQAALPHTATNGHGPAASTNGNGHHHSAANGIALRGGRMVVRPRRHRFWRSRPSPAASG